jgi:hypothetical protein
MQYITKLMSDCVFIYAKINYYGFMSMCCNRVFKTLNGNLMVESLREIQLTKASWIMQMWLLKSKSSHTIKFGGNYYTLCKIHCLEYLLKLDVHILPDLVISGLLVSVLPFLLLLPSNPLPCALSCGNYNTLCLSCYFCWHL